MSLSKEQLRQKLKEKLHIKTNGQKISRQSKFARDTLQKKLNEKKPTKAINHYLGQIEEKNEKEYLADGCEMFFSGGD
jgi:hypothetical protein